VTDRGTKTFRAPPCSVKSGLLRLASILPGQADMMSTMLWTELTKIYTQKTLMRVR